MKVITISAKAQNGKDLSAQLIKDELENKGERVLIAHYGDLLKYICKTFFEWDGNKDEEGRTLLQYVGTDQIRKKYPDYWVNFIAGILKIFPNDWDYVLIPDCRFPNEVQIMKDNFDTTSIKIVRPNFDNGLTVEQKEHSSETALDNYRNFDYIVVNDGTINELRNSLKQLLKI